MNRKEYEEKLECLTTQVAIFNKQIEELKNTKIEEDNVWRPTFGEQYWVVNTDGEVYNDFWDDYNGERNTLNIGNVFRTQEEAEYEVERRKVLVELKRFSSEFTYGDRNFYINLLSCGALSYNYRSNARTQGVIYFESEEIAKEAVKKVGEERTKIFLFGIE